MKQRLSVLFAFFAATALAQNKSNMKFLSADIIINASPEKVWTILTQFSEYEKWNPFIVHSEGKAEAGTRLTNKMKQGEKIFTFRPKLKVVKPQQELEWLGSLVVRGIFDGRHRFVIEDLGNGRVKLTQSEKFSGILSGMIMKKIATQTLQGFRAMNEALKAEAEK